MCISNLTAILIFFWFCNYYQKGFHDICAVFQQILGENYALLSIERISRYPLRDYLKPTLAEAVRNLGILFPLIALVDMPLHEYIEGYVCIHVKPYTTWYFSYLQIRSPLHTKNLLLFSLFVLLDVVCMSRSGLIDHPHFALAWLLTWFSHDICDVDVVGRLFDLFLSYPDPLLPVYCAAAVCSKAELYYAYNPLHKIRTCNQRSLYVTI